MQFLSALLGEGSENVGTVLQYLSNTSDWPEVRLLLNMQGTNGPRYPVWFGKTDNSVYIGATDNNEGAAFGVKVHEHQDGAE